jgi:DNA repair protein RadA/Sms
LSELRRCNTKWQDNVTPVKNGILLQRDQKKKDSLESRSSSRKAKAQRELTEIDSTQEIRMDTTDAELNRVLGGGIVPGSLILWEENQGGKNPLLQISLKLP